MGKLFIEEIGDNIANVMICSNCFTNTNNTKFFNRQDIVGKATTTKGEGYIVSDILNVFEGEIKDGSYSSIGRITIFDNNPINKGNSRYTSLYCNRCSDFSGFKILGTIPKFIVFSNSIF
jgi:hypothetical protein